MTYHHLGADDDNEVPDWAIDRAVEIMASVDNVARYVMRHETPPIKIDPDLELAREIAGRVSDDGVFGDWAYYDGGRYVDGFYDGEQEIKSILRAIKSFRGRE